MLTITRSFLEEEYLQKRKSVAEISKVVRCSENKINYWLSKYDIPKRNISEAMYSRHNPDGDPFSFKQPTTVNESFLFGLGLGLFWGEGNKKNKCTVRLGNTDPCLIKIFLFFLKEVYTINPKRLRFGLQIFSDISEREALAYWCKKLHVLPKQFYKVTTTPFRSIGTYRQKSKYGVLIVYFHNKKLRDRIVNAIEELNGPQCKMPS